MKNDLATLQALLVDYPGAISHPAMAKQVFFCHSHFEDSFVASLVREIVLFDGDWRRALADLRRQHAGFGARCDRFRKWAEKVTHREVRGLLEWKGGAS